MSEYDKDIKVGDLITAYHAGFHRVTEVEDRQEYNSLIHYTKVMTAEYTPRKTKVPKSCDSYFCDVLDSNAIENLRTDLIEKVNTGLDALMEPVLEEEPTS